MTKKTKIVLGLAAIVTIATLILWQVTGGDYYTKFEVVEQIEAPVYQDDPLDEAGFYDETSRTQTVTRSEFRFGLFPTPSRLFDKHAVSVVSIAFPIWVLAIGFVGWRRR